MMKFILTCLLILCFSHETNAHQLSTSYLNAHMNNDGAISGQYQIKLLDLERAIGIDVNKNGQLTWSEVISNTQSIQNWLMQTLVFSQDSIQCKTSFKGQLLIDSHYNDNYLSIPLLINCQSSDPITIEYTGVFNQDTTHKLLLNISTPNQQHGRVFSENHQKITIDKSTGSPLQTIKEYGKQGVIHIWIGIDHILFLLCLLMAVVISAHKNGTNQPLKQSFLSIVKIVTAFTLAHSITLTATVFNLIHPNSRWVEVGIAITVLLTAINNIVPVLKKIVWVTFLFGLLHGMGFASVLNEIGTSGSLQWLSILSFNLGVELGQVVILVIAVPVLFVFNHYHRNAHHYLKLSSGFVALLSCFWVFQRLG